MGGVAGLALIAILLWFLLKRRKSHRDDFDDMMVSVVCIFLYTLTFFSV